MNDEIMEDFLKPGIHKLQLVNACAAFWKQT